MIDGNHARCQSLRCLNFYSNSLQPPSRVFFFLLGGLAVLLGSSPGANFRNGSDGKPGFLKIPCAGKKFEESFLTPKDGSLAQPAEGRVFLLEGGLPLRTFLKDGLPCGGGRPHCIRLYIISSAISRITAATDTKPCSAHRILRPRFRAASAAIPKTRHPHSAAHNSGISCLVSRKERKVRHL